MDTWTFRKENEVKLNYAPRIAEEVWTRHRATIVGLHDAKKHREEIVDILRDQYKFKPSLGQLNNQMKKWGLKVYRPRSPEDGVNSTALLNLGIEEESRSSSREPIVSPLTSVSNTGSIDDSRIWESADNTKSDVGPVQDHVLLRSETSLATSSVRDAETQSLTVPYHNPQTQLTVAQGFNTSDRQTFFLAADTGIENSNTTSTAGRKVLEPAEINSNLEDVSECMGITETGAESVISLISNLRSDTSSVRGFKQLVYRLKFKNSATLSSRSQGSAMSIDSRESWDFSKVTGMPKDFKASDRQGELAASRTLHQWTSDEWLKAMTRELDELFMDFLKPAHERTLLTPWGQRILAMPVFGMMFSELALILDYDQFAHWVVNRYRLISRTKDTTCLACIDTIQQSIRIVLQKVNKLLQDPVTGSHFLPRGNEATHKLCLLQLKSQETFNNVQMTYDLSFLPASSDLERDFERHRRSWLKLRQEILEAVDYARAMAISTSDGEIAG